MMMKLPPSLTAPDALVAILLALHLTHKQHRTRSRPQPAGRANDSNNKKIRSYYSLFHEIFLTRLSVMVSPSAMASSLNANMIDLHTSKKNNNTNNKKKDSSSNVMEIRTRRIQPNELSSNSYYQAVETTMNLSFCAFLGLTLRWILGLVRSLRLSRATNTAIAESGGVCCSTYRGYESDTQSSFEKLLTCVLMKSEGDEAGRPLLTILLILLFVAVYRLAVVVTSSSSGGGEMDKRTTDEKGRYIYRRVSRQKVQRFFVGVGATLLALWLFHTPALLRYFGLIGLMEAVDELGARILLLGNLIGVVSINDDSGHYLAMLQNLSNLLLTVFAAIWGMYASVLAECIQETARNAAFVLSSNPSKRSKKKNETPDEMMALMNTRIMLVIMAVAPLVVLCTFFAETHFAETVAKTAARSGGGQASFSKQYLQNSGQFVRVGLSWSFLGASVYTIRALTQSYLDQASTVASAMSIYSEASGSKASKQTNSNQPDPFSDRYSKVVPTAGKIAAFPAFVFAILILAHLRGGDVSVHPGVGNENMDALSATAIKGLVPGYSGEYAMWIASRQGNQQQKPTALQAASLSQSTWEETPLRDKAHRYISDWMGREKFCAPPSPRAVKAMGRELNYLMLQSNDVSIDEDTTLPIAINGAQLLEHASPLPYTLIDVILGGKTSSEEQTCTNNDIAESEQTCTASTIPKRAIVSSVLSHNIITPTIIIPVVETLTLLSSVLWTVWYTVMVVWYWTKIRKSAGLHISA